MSSLPTIRRASTKSCGRFRSINLPQKATIRAVLGIPYFSLSVSSLRAKAGSDLALVYRAISTGIGHQTILSSLIPKRRYASLFLSPATRNKLTLRRNILRRRSFEREVTFRSISRTLVSDWYQIADLVSSAVDSTNQFDRLA